MMVSIKRVGQSWDTETGEVTNTLELLLPSGEVVQTRCSAETSQTIIHAIAHGRTVAPRAPEPAQPATYETPSKAVHIPDDGIEPEELAPTFGGDYDPAGQQGSLFEQPAVVLNAAEVPGESPVASKTVPTDEKGNPTGVFRPTPPVVDDEEEVGADQL